MRYMLQLLQTAPASSTATDKEHAEANTEDSDSQPHARFVQLENALIACM